ncbi:MAG TPA: outer membrane lipid asymmetry maintenance protein MlaD [Candidatus Sulfobium mesophilum]|jgi:phospholipid/cholesterol/gamma-HCH transport system substrate-binding protein|uniref:ABC transporter substrate binding protein n=1 Tax=Candidatus Sulfobium mesophilum TaxID=2016548 RepID=A0A2U3QDT9_9BACT|nr:Putative ABC transporter substrate binding protein [Candidatus Sulfobium mesophilum]HSB31918.1 outer membrane lipid asymmetry maintenance protein MlaD [Candidatus Sulfobium mesophilum]
MKKIDLETAVGFFLLIGIFSLAYISVKLGRLEVLGNKGYEVYAEFEQVGGIKPGASVEIAGIAIGRVTGMRLNDYQALLSLEIDKGIKLQEDSIASVRTKGLIGEKYILITPGGSEKIIADGGKIRETESAIDTESLMSKYIFGKI